EAGLVLQGTEVKSIRAGKVTIAESFITIDGNQEAWIYNMNIGHYEFGNIHNHEEGRKRKLLLNAKEIEEIYHRMKAESLTLVPTIIYFTNNRVKIEIALGKGRKQYDKRQDKAKKDVEKKLRRGQYD
ncbi:SsrA-binding protein SmpB, partial [Bacteriovoracaceae bacterium]|nr:SsrA-binding protein SmpB [Bacteriovoracaceae bacterium]